MTPFETGEVFHAVCIVPSSALEVAKLAAFDTFFVDGAHMKDSKGETQYDSAQLLTIVMKTSLIEKKKDDIITKNLPLAYSLCLAESTDEYAFLYWTCAVAGFSLNRKDKNICHDRGKAVIAARQQVLPLAASFYCNVHLKRNIQELKGVGKFSDEVNALFFEMTQAMSESEFLAARTKLCAKLPQNGKDYIMELDVNLISAYHFSRENSKSVCFYNTNPVEQENQLNMDARWMKNPLDVFYKLLEIFNKRFVQFQELFDKTNDQGIILKTTRDRVDDIERRKLRSTFRCNVEDAVHEIVQVNTNVSLKVFFTVNMEEHWCSCGKFQERKYPCIHAAAAAGILKITPSDFWNLFDPIHRNSNIKKAFNRSIAIPPRATIPEPERDERLIMTRHFQQVARTQGRPSKNKRKMSRGENLPGRKRASYTSRRETQASGGLLENGNTLPTQERTEPPPPDGDELLSQDDNEGVDEDSSEEATAGFGEDIDDIDLSKESNW